jgi:DNA-binding NarL/FixJ family response regulator
MLGSGASVLIVDDNSLLRSTIRAFLERNSELNVCGEAADGADAVEKANVLKPGLILMDLAMPKMNGLQAARAIKRVMPEARIVMFTLHSEAVGKLTESKSGVDLVVSKSEGLEELLRVLQLFLSKDGFQPVH